MPETIPDGYVEAAEAAIEHAQTVRAVHRRKTGKGAPQREADLRLALKRIKDAMAPLRSMIGKFPYGPQTDRAEANRERIYDLSRSLQVERRKLWKMQQR